MSDFKLVERELNRGSDLEIRIPAGALGPVREALDGSTEECYALLADKRYSKPDTYNVIYVETVAFGNESSVETPWHVFDSLAHMADETSLDFVLGHNHPNGTRQPSEDDKSTYESRVNRKRGIAPDSREYDTIIFTKSSFSKHDVGVVSVGRNSVKIVDEDLGPSFYAQSKLREYRNDWFPSLSPPSSCI